MEGWTPLSPGHHSNVRREEHGMGTVSGYLLFHLNTVALHIWERGHDIVVSSQLAKKCGTGERGEEKEEEEGCGGGEEGVGKERRESGGCCRVEHQEEGM